MVIQWIKGYKIISGNKEGNRRPKDEFGFQLAVARSCRIWNGRVSFRVTSIEYLVRLHGARNLTFHLFLPLVIDFMAINHEITIVTSLLSLALH
jgi:hypothetical protein